MDIYISGTKNDNIALMSARLEYSANGKTASTIGVKTAGEIRECDRISIKREDETVFSGVVMAVKQRATGAAVTNKVYRLNVAGESDRLKGVLTDMQFPSGVNAAQVLFGNKPGQNGYDAGLPVFQGVLETRVEPEGITVGEIADLSFAKIDGPAYLWGIPVFDLLEKICEAAGAYWELTPDGRLNIYGNEARPTAPLLLDKTAKIFDIKPSRDAYTLYSAVRVIGASGEGSMLTTKIRGFGDMNNPLARISDDGTELKFKFPVSHGLSLCYCSAAGEDLQVILVGYSGDDTDSADVVATRGNTVVKAKGNFTFPAPESGGYIFAEYIPLVPIVARLCDPALCDELKAQRGGTGVIEYTLRDNSIKDFAAASSLGLKFLKTASRRAKSVVFKTRIGGIFPGMVFKGANLPFYGVMGEYVAGRIEAELLSDGGFEYTVTASTVPYKSAGENLFARQVSFALGSDFPANDGILSDREITVDTALSAGEVSTPSWKTRQTASLNWAQWQAKYQNFASILETEKEYAYMGAFLTPAGKARLLDALEGTALGAGKLDLTHALYAVSENGTRESVTKVAAVRQTDGVVSTYYAGFSDANMKITSLECKGPDGTVLQEIPVSVDKSGGGFALTVTKRDSV